MELALYRLLGVNQYRKLVIWVKRKYDHLRGKVSTDNYFLKDPSYEGILFLKNQLVKNAKIHLAGVLIGLLLLVTAQALGVGIAGAIIFLHNLYCVMIQRYNLLRIAPLLEKKRRKQGAP